MYTASSKGENLFNFDMSCELNFDLRQNLARFFTSGWVVGSWRNRVVVVETIFEGLNNDVSEQQVAAIIRFQ